MTGTKIWASYPLCWLPDGAAPVLCPALPLPGLPLAYPFLGCLPPKTHHGSAGCPSVSSTLGSPASFPGALALSSWARAPSSRARCRHDLSSERVTFEETCRHRMLSASQLPYIPLPSPWSRLLTLSFWGASLGSCPAERAAFFVFLVREECSGEPEAAGEPEPEAAGEPGPGTWEKGPQR